MGLSRGWCGLVLFWAGIVSLGGVGAVTLEVLGPPPATVDSERADLAGRAQAVVPEAISYSTPIARITREPTPVVAPEIPAAADGSGPEDTQVQAASPPRLPETGTDAKMMVASETTAAPNKKDNVGLTPVSRDTLSESGVAAVANAVDEASEVAPQNTDRAKKKLHLRIARDKRRCGQTACLTWRLVKRQA